MWRCDAWEVYVWNASGKREKFLEFSVCFRADEKTSLAYREGELADDVCDAKVLVSLIARSSVDVDRKATDSGLRACAGHTNTTDFGNNNLGVLGELLG